MQQKKSSKWLLLTVGTMVVIFSIGSVFLFVGKKPNGLSKDIALGEQVLPSLPARISIAKINVDAVIESVGLTKDGSIGVPNNPSSTAWFNGSPLPGENGNSIIVGHFGWKNSIPAVFDNLYKIKIGDEITVEDNIKTSRASYTVDT